MTMMIEKQFTKLLKPFVPTPPTLRHYKLGFIDEFVPAINVGIVLFYSANSNHNPKFVAGLEKSLEKTLAQFYPLAGRYVDENHAVDCSDQGAEFTYAKVNITLDIILSVKDVKFIDEFIPSKIGSPRQFNDLLLATQVTVFECGGIALGVSATHKLVDASTLCTFINEWAVVNREEKEVQLIGPGFNSSLLFPARDLPPLPLEPMNHDMLRNYTRKKISFSENVISNMKAISTRRLSKVQLVSALIWKAMIGVDRAIHNYPRDSILIQVVNLRGKMASLIPKNSCGNLLGVCVTGSSTTLETTEDFAVRLSDSVKKTITNFSKASHENEEGQTVVLNSLSMTNIPESSNVIMLTSWCSFSFYEADFGSGKPIWVAPGLIPAKNSAYLMDDVGGNGVEAYVFLETKDVPYLKEALYDNAKMYGFS